VNQMSFTNSYSTMTGFAGVNSPSFLSTGSFTLTGDMSIIDAPAAVTGTTIGVAGTAIPNTGYSVISAGSSAAVVRGLLDAPVAGAIKTVLFLGDTTIPTVSYLLASNTSAVTAYFGGNTSSNQLQAGAAFSKLLVTLVGQSTAQWLITSISTLNNISTGTISVNSSNT
jgi:hypothetical protein